MNNVRLGLFMQTFTGRKFWPLDPLAEEVFVEDIAHALALTCRFGGHSRRFYSVAHHSVLVSQACAPTDAMWGLLHDSAEAYAGDVIRPIKHGCEAGSRFCRVEERILEVIARRFGLSMPIPVSVRRADEIVLATECRDVMGGERAGKWALDHAPSDNLITPWSAEESEHAFLARFAELDAARKAAA